MEDVMDVATGALVVLVLAVAMAAYWLIWINDPESSGMHSPTDSPPRKDPQLRIERILRRATDLAKTGRDVALRRRRKKP